MIPPDRMWPIWHWRGRKEQSRYLQGTRRARGRKTGKFSLELASGLHIQNDDDHCSPRNHLQQVQGCSRQWCNVQARQSRKQSSAQSIQRSRLVDDMDNTCKENIGQDLYQGAEGRKSFGPKTFAASQGLVCDGGGTPEKVKGWFLLLRFLRESCSRDVLAQDDVWHLSHNALA